MTLRADHLGMFAAQLKFETSVIEIIPVTIHSVVARKAVRAKGKEMGLGEGNADLTVAGLAGVWGEGRDVALMTIIAGERYIRSRELVTVQGESHHLMRESRVLHHREFRIGAAMFRVTMTATEIGIFVQKSAVHGCDIAHLYSNIRVTVRAAIRHNRRFPGRGVTGSAVAANLRVGCDTTKHFSTLCIQRAGVIYQTAACISIAGDHKCCDQRGDQASAC